MLKVAIENSISHASANKAKSLKGLFSPPDVYAPDTFRCLESAATRVKATGFSGRSGNVLRQRTDIAQFPVPLFLPLAPEVRQTRSEKEEAVAQPRCNYKHFMSRVRCMIDSRLSAPE